MKRLFAILVLLFCQVTMAEIVQPSDQALDEDLNFRLVEENSKNRQIASDKEEKNDEQTDSEGERDVASDQDDQSNKIQYWKY